MNKKLRAITPVIAVVVLMVMTVAAAAMAFLTISSYQSEVKSGSQAGVELIGSSTGTRLRIESVSGGKIYLRNLGGETYSNPAFYVEGKPLNVSGPVECESGAICVYTVLENVTCTGDCELDMGAGAPVGAGMSVTEQDLGLGSSCGDSTCDAGEGCYSCPSDCSCGTGLCCNVTTDSCGDCDLTQSMCEYGSYDWLDSVVPWWNSSFHNRKEFIITEESGSSLTNYQVEIEPSTYDTNGLVASYHFSDDLSIIRDSSGNGNDLYLKGSTEGLWHFDKNNYTTAHDETFNGYDGTITNAVWNDTSCKSGSCLTFSDASDSRITFSSSVRSGCPTTVCAWAKPQSVTDGDHHYLLSNGGENSAGYGFYIKTDNLGNWTFGYRHPSSYRAAIGGVPAYVGWTHICGVVNGSATTDSVLLYINGTFMGSSQLSSDTTGSAQNLKIGGSFLNNDWNWDGEIDEVAIYDYALNDTEIQQLYDASNAQFIEYKKGYKEKGVSLNFEKASYAYTNSPSNLPSGDGAKSMSAWFTLGSTCGTHSCAIGGFGNPSNSQNFQIIAATNGNFMVYGWGTSYDWNTGISFTPYKDGDWHHVAVTADGTTTRFYLDGVQRASTTSYNWNTNPVRIVIGDEIDFTGNPHVGRIDEFRIYNRELNSTEVEYLYNETRGRYDYGDLRFVDSNNNELDYYFELDDSVWVEVSSIPASDNATIWMYYNNTDLGVLSESNGEDTFLFFDDFDDDLSKWIPNNTAGIDASIEHGELSLDGRADETFAKMTINTSTFSMPFIVEYDQYEEGYYVDTTNWMGVQTAMPDIDDWATTEGNTFLLRHNANYLLFVDGTQEIGDTASGITPTEKHRIKFINTNGHLWVDINGVNKIDWTGSTPQTSGYVGVRSYGFDQQVDDFRIRKYASTEPSVTIGVTQFSDTSMQNYPCCGDDSSSDYFFNNTHSCCYGSFQAGSC